jgi:hypothetical protein
MVPEFRCQTETLWLDSMSASGLAHSRFDMSLKPPIVCSKNTIALRNSKHIADLALTKIGIKTDFPTRQKSSTALDKFQNKKITRGFAVHWL